MNALVKRTSELVDHKKLVEYCRRNGIARLAVFGSFLTDAFHTDSDLDLLVTFAPAAEIGFLALGRMRRELSELFGLPVDLVPQEGLKPAIRRTVLERTVEIYPARRENPADQAANQEGLIPTGRNLPIPYARDQLADLCRRWQVVELALFGSTLRGDSRMDGEIDVLVSFASETDWSLFERVALQDELSALFGREAHLVERGAPHDPNHAGEHIYSLRVLYPTAAGAGERRPGSADRGAGERKTPPGEAPARLDYRTFRRLQNLFERLAPPAQIDGLGEVDYFHLYAFLADVAGIEVPETQAAVHRQAVALLRCGYRAEEITEAEYVRLLELLASTEAADPDDLALHDFGPHRTLYEYLTEGLGLYVEPGRGPVWGRAKELIRQHEQGRGCR